MRPKQKAKLFSYKKWSKMCLLTVFDIGIASIKSNLSETFFTPLPPVPTPGFAGSLHLNGESCLMLMLDCFTQIIDRETCGSNLGRRSCDPCHFRLVFHAQPVQSSPFFCPYGLLQLGICGIVLCPFSSWVLSIFFLFVVVWWLMVSGVGWAFSDSSEWPTFQENWNCFGQNCAVSRRCFVRRASSPLVWLLVL